MSWIDGLRRRMDETLRPGRSEAELDEELRDHLAREVERQLDEGVPGGEARRRALARAGNLQAAREAARDEQAGRIFRDAVADLRIAGRAARRNPGFSAAVVVSLALGVGGTTAVYSFVDAVLVRRLPYADEDRLFLLRVWWNDFSATLSPADFLALQEHARGMASVGAFFLPNDGFAMTTQAGPEVVNGAIVLSNNYTIEGGSPGTAGSSGVAEWQVVTPEYFTAMGIGLAGGRSFTVDDRAASPRVAMVNESFARKHHPEGRAIGQRLKGGDFDPAAPWITVVGIVRDVAYGKGLWGGADPTVYLPYAQNLWVESPYVIVKAEGDPARVVTAAQEAVTSMDPNLPLRDVATMQERLRLSMLEPRLRSLLFALIAGMALALAVTGIHGVMAYHVNQRRRETAIRRALGARPQDVVRTIVSMGSRLVAAGIVLGTGGAIIATRSLSAMLFQVSRMTRAPSPPWPRCLPRPPSSRALFPPCARRGSIRRLYCATSDL